MISVNSTEKQERELDKVVEQQPLRCSRSAFVAALIQQAIDAVKNTGDPAAWQNPAAQTATSIAAPHAA